MVVRQTHAKALLWAGVKGVLRIALFSLARAINLVSGCPTVITDPGTVDSSAGGDICALVITPPATIEKASVWCEAQLEGRKTVLRKGYEKKNLKPAALAIYC
jgi:hypothetical protein